MRIAVIAGGPSSEANVSRASARAVARALSEAGHAPEVVELDADLAQALGQSAFDVAFPVTHGPLGEDGCLQGLLEVLDLPYVGPGVLSSALAASKPHAKVMFRAANLPLAPEELVHRSEPLSERAATVRSRLGRAVVVKPASGGSAIATTRVRDADPDSALVAALERALDIDSTALVEGFVPGHEVTCGVLEDDDGRRALPPTLIISKAADWYDFQSRYAPGGSEHRCPAPLPEVVLHRVQTVALAAFSALGCRDLARVDFVVGDGEDSVTLLEVNTLPGMTATSLYPEAAKAAGIEFPALCDGLARRAHARPRRESPRALAMPE